MRFTCRSKARKALPEAQRAAADHVLMEITGLCLLQKRFALR
jgi:asparagine synthase (glutamine-hydrolysing)